MWGNLVDFFLNRVNLIADIIFQYKLVIGDFKIFSTKYQVGNQRR